MAIEYTFDGRNLTGFDEKTGLKFMVSYVSTAGAWETATITLHAQIEANRDNNLLPSVYLNELANAQISEDAGKYPHPDPPAKPLKTIVGDGWLDESNTLRPGTIVRVPFDNPPLPDYIKRWYGK